MKLDCSASFEYLTGRDDSCLQACWSGHLVHPEVLEPLQQLRLDADAAGFELAIASSYRSYERQRFIWQEKLAGRRPLLDANERPLNIAEQTEEQVLWAMLRWSAIPGASRHHWGTDLDIFDARALQEQGLKLQLTVAECKQDGPLFDFHCWLDEYLRSLSNPGFVRPYCQDSGGVAPEPWHISFKPVSNGLQQAYDFDLFQRLLSEDNLPLNGLIHNHAQEIFDRYIALC
jgi:LAS superfamily LD-carboxypeptidase LdcB